MPAASERRSLLTGIPMESRRGEKSGQRLYSARPEQGFSIEGPRPCALSLELPGAERSGEAYRRSLSHDCTIASSPLAELDVCLDRMAAPILYEGKNPILIRFAPKHISGTSCDGEGVCIFRSLVTTSPRIWWETRAWRELSELQSCGLSGSVSLDLRRTQPLSPEQWSTAVEPELFV